MKDRQTRRKLPLILIALLLPAFAFTAHRAWTILRQSDQEQATFDALARQVAQADAPEAEPAPTPETSVVTARLNGEDVRVDVYSYDPVADTIKVYDASGSERTAPLEDIEALAGEVDVPDDGAEGTVALARADIAADTVTVKGADDTSREEGLRSVLTRLRQTAAAQRPVLPQYRALIAQNQDIFGWIRIDGTAIDYPVMHSPEEPERYLHRDFYGKYSYSGVPFLDGGCAEDGNYFIIYAHHMKDGTMFGRLSEYAHREYCEAHPLIRLDTRYETRTYRVAAAFNSRIYKESEKRAFRYYAYTDLRRKADFEAYMAGVQSAALYDTGVKIAYGDELLALSTCDYSTPDGRFVVIAKRVSNEDQNMTD